MLEHAVAILVVTFLLGLATWHAARVMAEGSIFADVRNWLEFKATRRWVDEDDGEGILGYWLVDTVQPWHFANEGLTCRLCLNTQVAFAFTWGALVVGVLAYSSRFSPAEWGLAFVIGPFLVAGWAEVVRRLET